MINTSSPALDIQNILGWVVVAWFIASIAILIIQGAQHKQTVATIASTITGFIEKYDNQAALIDLAKHVSTQTVPASIIADLKTLLAVATPFSPPAVQPVATDLSALLANLSPQVVPLNVTVAPQSGATAPQAEATGAPSAVAAPTPTTPAADPPAGQAAG